MAYKDLNKSAEVINDILDKANDPIITISQGGIEGNLDYPVYNKERVRTDTILPSGTIIKTTGEVVIWLVVLYDASTFAYFDGVNPKNQEYTIPSDKVAKVVFAKTGGTGSITPEEVFKSILRPKVAILDLKAAVMSYISSLVVDMLLLEQGGLDPSTGDYTTDKSAQRVRCKNYIPGGIRVNCTGSIVIWLVVYYNLTTLTFAKAVNPKNQSYYLEDGYMARVVFAKTGGTTNITPDEVTKNKTYGSLLTY